MERLMRKGMRYRPYSVFGNSSEIPARTQRYWKAKKRQMSKNNENEIRQRDRENMDTGRRKDSADVLKSGEDERLQFEQTLESHIVEPNLEDNRHETYESSDNDEDDVFEIDESFLESEYSKDVLIRTLLVIATQMRYKLPYAAAEDILRLANVLNNSNHPKDTKYHWKKILNVFSNFLQIHHFCEHCQFYVGAETNGDREAKNPVGLMMCQACDQTINMERNWESGNIMIYLRLTDQLQHLFQLEHETIIDPKVREKQNEYAIEDIFDGALYKKNLSDGMISLNMNIDGTPLFDSSPISIYPVLCTVNELPPKRRGKCMMMCSLWFGKGKPKYMNEVLKPFVEEAQRLFHSGFEYTYNGEQFFRKCRILTCICDSIARPVVRNSTQFNGEYGCGLCMHPGIQVPVGDGPATVRVYPIDATDNPFGESLRTHEETLIHAVNKEKGIKDRSLLCDLEGFNIIDNLPPDWMHAVALGVSRQFASLWFDSSSHRESYYLGRSVKAIDTMIQLFRPTLDVSRTPRKITERSFWRAHEWTIWLLFYSLPILNEIAPGKYVEHWALLVDGVSILLQTSIRKSEIHYARQCLYDFVKGVKTLYGVRYISFNVHLLTHLPDSVLNWGPLWAHSAFIYESFNHELKTSVHSANGAAIQVCDTFRHKCVLRRLENLCESSMTYSQLQYLTDMLVRKCQPKVSISVDGVKIVGNVNSMTILPRPYYLALQGLDVSADLCQSIQLAQRIIIGSEQIHSKKYLRPQKRASYIVLLRNEEVFEIEEFLILSARESAQCYAVGRYYNKMHVAAFRNRCLNHMIYLQEICKDIAAVNVSMIKEKVTLLHIVESNVFFACFHPNHFELLT